MGQNYTVSIKYDYILMQTKFSPDPIPQPYLPPKIHYNLMSLIE